MNILALDTATPILSIALTDEKNMWYFEADAGNRHSEIIMDTIDTLFSRSGIKSKDLDLIACMKGPGSFTGLRIGYAVAKGICLPFGINMAAAGTLDCMAYSRRDWDGIVLPAIDAKKHAYFTAFFDKGERFSEDMDADAGHIAENFISFAPETPVLLTGPDAAMLLAELKQYIPAERLHLDCEYRRGFAKALLALAPDHTEKDMLSGPKYIRKSDAEIGAGR